MLRRLALLAALAAVGAPASASAAPVPARSYLGVADRGGVVTFGVGRGARRVLSFRALAVPGRCAGAPGTIDASGIPMRIGPTGRFHGAIVEDIVFRVRGHLLAAGRAEGRFAYEDRGDCQAAGTWRARVDRRATGRGPRIFPLAGGGRRQRAGGRPAGDVEVDAGGLAERPGGALAIADSRDSSHAFVRSLGPFGRLTDVAGLGPSGATGDGGPATAARVSAPLDVASEPGGALLIADAGAACIRRVGANGIIRTVAGRCRDDGSTAGFSGDGGPATAARLDYPAGVAARPGGGFVVADTGNDRVREVSPAGVITTIAGTGASGFSGDGGPGTAARLDRPNDVAVEASGGILVADEDNGRVRRIAPTGTITTVAGGGTPSVARGVGDGRPATAATILDAYAASALPGGAFLVVDPGLARVRRVGADGTITTVLGGGPLPGLHGVRAADAELGYPIAALPQSGGGLAVSDSGALYEVPGAHPARLLVAPLRTDLAARRGHSATLHIATTRRCRLSAASGGRRVGVAAPAGVTRLRLPALGRGRHRIHLTARAGRRVATAWVRLTVR